jgi:hypothetical protein
VRGTSRDQTARDRKPSRARRTSPRSGVDVPPERDACKAPASRHDELGPTACTPARGTGLVRCLRRSSTAARVGSERGGVTHHRPRGESSIWARFRGLVSPAPYSPLRARTETYDLFQLGRSYLRAAGWRRRDRLARRRPGRPSPSLNRSAKPLGIAYSDRQVMEAEAEFRAGQSSFLVDEFAHYAAWPRPRESGRAKRRCRTRPVARCA